VSAQSQLNSNFAKSDTQLCRQWHSCRLACLLCFAKFGFGTRKAQHKQPKSSPFHVADLIIRESNAAIPQKKHLNCFSARYHKQQSKQQTVCEVSDVSSHSHDDNIVSGSLIKATYLLRFRRLAHLDAIGTTRFPIHSFPIEQSRL